MASELDLHGLFEHNSTFEYEDYEYKEDCIKTRTIVATFFSVLYSVALVLGLLGNVMMLVVLWQKRRSWSVTDAFVLHLSVADLLLLLTVPLWAVDAVRGWSLGSGVCKLTGVLFKINFYFCIFLLTCISLHLYRSINHTRQMGLCRKPRLVHLLCLAVWIFCLILSIPDWMYLKAASNSDRENDIECVYEYPSRASRVASCLCFHVLGFWIPAIVLLSCSTCVLERCRSDQHVQKRRAVYVILVLCIVFFLSWTPYNIALLVDTFQDLPSKSTIHCDDHRWTALKITHAVGVLHSCFNPLIYLGFSEKFRRWMLTVVTCGSCAVENGDFFPWDFREIDTPISVPQEEKGSLCPTNDTEMTVTQTQQENNNDIVRS